MGLALTPNNNGGSAIPAHFLAVVNMYCFEGVPSVEGYFQGTIYMSAWITVPFLGTNQIPLQYPIDSLNLYPESTILGCTDESACNYDEEATANNGECDYSNAHQVDVQPLTLAIVHLQGR